MSKTGADNTRCFVCGGAFSVKRVTIDGFTMHESCSIASYPPHKPSDMDRLCAIVADRERTIDSLRARVAELEAENTNLRKIVDAIKDNPPMSSHTELVALLIQVMHCGGDCSAELLAKIERATQKEAGWTDTTIISSSSSEEEKIIAQPRPAQSPAAIEADLR